MNLITVSNRLLRTPLTSFRLRNGSADVGLVEDQLGRSPAAQA